MAFTSQYTAAKLCLTLSEVTPSYVVNASLLPANTYTTFTTILSTHNLQRSSLAYVLVPTQLLPAIDDVSKLSQHPAEVVAWLVLHPRGSTMEWHLDVKSITFDMNRPASECSGIFDVFLHRADEFPAFLWVDSTDVWAVCRAGKPRDILW